MVKKLEAEIEDLKKDKKSKKRVPSEKLLVKDNPSNPPESNNKVADEREVMRKRDVKEVLKNAPK